MKPKTKYLLLGIVILVFLILLFSLVYQKRKTIGLFAKPSPSSTPIITPTSEPTPSPSPSPTPTPSPLPSPSPTPPPSPQPTYNSEQINTFIEQYAGQYGVDANTLRQIAVCESNFNPAAVNDPYAGLYQFNPTTWKNNRAIMGEETSPDLRFNAEEAVQTAAFILSIDRGGIWPNCFP